MAAQVETSYRTPDVTTLQHVCKLSIVNDKPVMMDYWVNSVEKKVIIGVREGGEKLLVKNEEEYTSPIGKVYKVKEDFIIETENSYYLVDSAIDTKKIS
jgi:hypothetical protein|tara:strand:+ start:124 stop:420 length:297 start_codon:yes stop_codon:yes gene_type:complete